MDDYIGNEALIEEYLSNMKLLGETVDIEPKISGSSDIGNLSYLMPTLCPIVKIALKGVELHTLEMAHSSYSKTGNHGLITGTKALAMTGLRILSDSEFFEENVILYYYRNGNKNDFLQVSEHPPNCFPQTFMSG